MAKRLNIEQMKGGLSNLLGGEIPPKEEENRNESPILETMEDQDLKNEIVGRRKENRGRPRKGETKEESAKYQVVCFKGNKEKMEKMREIASREGLTIKDVMEMAIDNAIRSYEKQNGTITPSLKGTEHKNIF